jgi:hypothetical protein
VSQCIISPVPCVFPISQMEKEEEEERIVDFAETLRGSINEKIN